ncbi:MAG: lysylphosphatidylglycerol synthase transmembrane domain-containing protein [Acidobacteriota bacterium]
MPEKKTKLIILKSFIGIFLLGILIYKFKQNRIESFQYAFNVYFLLSGIFLHLFAFLIVTLRIHVLISSKVSSYYETLKIFLIGWFFSNILPTNIAGDGYMILYLKKKTESVTEAVALIAFQRFVGLIVLIIYGIGYLLFNPDWLKRISFNISFDLIMLIMVLLIIIIIFVLIFFKNQVYRFFKKIKKFFNNFKYIIKGIGVKKHFYVILTSIVYHLLRLGGFLYFLSGFTQKVPAADILFIMVIVTIGSLIPISIGGLGVQESILTLALTLLGVPLPIALIVSFINRAVLIFVAMSGSLMFLFDRKNKLI